jgi:hypothetical protein
MNPDIFSEISKHIDSPEDLDSFCRISLQNSKFCKTYKNYFIKKMFKTLKVDYKEPGNLIYIYNKKSINDFYNGTWDLVGIYKLYMNLYKEEEIIVYNNKNLTHVPILPHIITLKLLDCNVIYCPTQPSMVDCNMEENNLKSFPIQPSMVTCNLSKNKLVSFSSQPRLTDLYLDDNLITDMKFGVSHRNLFALYMNKNKLSKMDWTGASQSLDTVYFDSNNIDSLDWYGCPRSLTKIYLGNNRITKINWDNIPNLTDLDLSRNNLDKLDGKPPKSLEYLVIDEHIDIETLKKPPDLEINLVEPYVFEPY